MILMEPSLLRHYESANLAIERFVVKKTCVKKKKKKFLKINNTTNYGTEHTSLYK